MLWMGGVVVVDGVSNGVVVVHRIAQVAAVVGDQVVRVAQRRRAHVPQRQRALLH